MYLFSILIVFSGVIIANAQICEHGNPLVLGGTQVFCGRGPTRQDCPQGFKCNIHPTDIYAVCCRESKCKYGNPLVLSGQQVFCGRGLNRQDCPPGYECNIHPTDRYAVCCSICPPPQVFDECVSDCPPDCNPPPPFCTLKCNAKCRCPDHLPIHVFDAVGNIIKCVKKRKDCCPANLVWATCVSSSCTATCDNPNPNPCTADCVSKCVCPKKKPILHNGKCIKLKKCPVPCYPPNHPFMKCECKKCKKCKGKSIPCPKGNNMCKKKKHCCCCKYNIWKPSCN